MKSMAGADQRSESSKPEDGGTSAPAADQTVSTTDDPTVAPAPRLPSPDDPTRTSTGKLENEPPISLRGDRDDRLPAPLQIRDPERYQIIGEHGRGGLGRVFRARDKELGRDVAVKELLKRGTTAELRFFREALITARLEHPGIVPVHEAGRWPDGTPFYAMKLVQGRPLKALIDECKTLEERLALLPHVIAVADAIAYAHDRKIIHRDLKPSNVIVGDFGETVVIDWGLAKDLTDQVPDATDVGQNASLAPYRALANDGLTVAGSVLGTPAYMSPEQARGESLDETADVYAIGAILQELCEGARPTMDRESWVALPHRRLPADLRAIITRACSQVPAGRYRSAKTLSADLRAYLDGKHVSARKYSRIDRVRHWLRRHKQIARGLSIASAIVAVVALLALRTVIAAQREAEHAHERTALALASAEEERDRARLSEATLLLERDPTAAATLLRTVPTDSKFAVLRARAEARAAETTIDLPERVYTLTAAHAGDRVGVFLVDGSIRQIDLASGKVAVLNEAATGPMAATQTGWVYSATSTTSGHAIHNSDSASIIPTDDLLNSATSELFWTTEHIYARAPDGRFSILGRRWPSHLVIALDARAAAVTDKGALVCLSSGALLHVPSSTNSPSSVAGTCSSFAGAYSIAWSTSGHAVVESPTSLRVMDNDRSTTVSFRSDGDHVVRRSDAGVVAGIDSNYQCLYMRRNEKQFRTVGDQDLTATFVATRGTVVACGYANGDLVAVDTDTNHRWAWNAHTSGITGLAILPEGGLLVTTAEKQVRAWRLPASAGQNSALMPTTVFNATPSPKDRSLVALDGDDGRARLWDIRSRQVVDLHRHQDTSFGIVWSADEICSSGWDGFILCTPRGGGPTRVASSGHGRIRDIASVPGERAIIFIGEDKTLWETSESRNRALFSYPAESDPALIAISGTGDWIASVTFEGELYLLDRRTNETRHTTATHGYPYSMSWVGDELVISSMDGTLTSWTTNLQSRMLVRDTRPLREAIATPTLLAVSADERTLVLRSSRIDTELDLGSRIQDLALSPSGSLLIATTRTDAIIVDLENASLAALPVQTAPPSCAFFVDSTRFALCLTGTVSVTDLSTLTFVTFQLRKEP